jgi:hypothetical protein
MPPSHRKRPDPFTPSPAHARHPRRDRHARPGAEPLEGRDLPSIVGLAFSASPRELRPINPRNQPHAVSTQHVIPVALTATLTDTTAVPTLTYQVIDQFGQYQPSGTLTPQAPAQPGLLTYSARIGLSVLRAPSGRTYTIVLTARDPSGTTQAEAVVSVPPVGFFQRAFLFESTVGLRLFLRQPRLP